ncbi:hypothetical protein DAPPUDRAFT_238929 [Daphnia pulex]|uniref:Uncharacterized protein n=1 Tax=Daphnia pulex TaxID=6669 RepID=E9G7U1_DAPPU|nr:hypothetical protein DAPPUDRAFT_238929 [Daphnia pulex]|eukprot:EFX84540.1 hypothetical protein DAPPUDRAFT_238929 [Daphnia pulex]
MFPKLIYPKLLQHFRQKQTTMTKISFSINIDQLSSSDEQPEHCSGNGDASDVVVWTTPVAKVDGPICSFCDRHKDERQDKTLVFLCARLSSGDELTEGYFDKIVTSLKQSERWLSNFFHYLSATEDDLKTFIE